MDFTQDEIKTSIENLRKSIIWARELALESVYQVDRDRQFEKISKIELRITELEKMLN